MGKVIVQDYTYKKPITMIGVEAGICWGANTSNDEKNYLRGIDCLESGHGRTFEFPDVYLTLEGYSARVIREWYTHIGGLPTRLQASTRYIDYEHGFGYVTPPSIEGNPEAKKVYEDLMEHIKSYLESLDTIGVPREDSALGLPLGMETKIVCKHNMRNLMDMSHQRMCNRAYTKTDEFGYISYTDEGIAFASKIFEVLNEVKDNFTDAYSFNIESVPAERAAVILCQKDNVLYDHNDKFIYSNQWIPLSAKCTIQEKLRLSSILDEKCSGGSIAHINLESNFPNTETAWKMLNKIAQAGVIYFAFNTRINECKNHHGFVGTDHCPVCGEPVFDTYQRIVGYLVPSRAYSKDRFREFNTRQWYSYAEAMSE